jgi:hypothetical protein
MTKVPMLFFIIKARNETGIKEGFCELEFLPKWH